MKRFQQYHDRTVPGPGWLALKWNYLGNAVRGLSQFLIGILLARLLGPEPFGIVAIAGLVLGIGNLFADLGFGAALVQGKTVSDLQLRFVLTVQLIFSLFMMGIGMALAPCIAGYFHQPQVAAVIATLFVMFPLQAMGQTAAALLRRALDFKTLQTITIISYLAAYLGLGLPAAWCGFGVWSLVAAQLTQAALNSLLLIRLTRVPLKPCFHREGDVLLWFGLKVTAANLSSWGISNLDTVCLGRTFGAADLGLYNRAANLLITPMNIVATGFQSVLFAACARAQSDREQIRRIYLETTAAVALLCCPIFFTAALIPATLIDGIYGKRWSAAVPLVLPLALAVLVNALLAIKGPVLMASNRVGVELKNQLCTILLFIPFLLLAVRYAMATVAWAVFAAYLVRWMLLTIDTLRVTKASILDYLAVLPAPACCGACVALTAAIADRALFFVPAFPRLLLVAAVAALTVLTLVHCFGRHLLPMLGTLVDRNALSPGMRRLLKIEVAA
jgi:O-antigen/teichoic acid export membrane protein